MLEKRWKRIQNTIIIDQAKQLAEDEEKEEIVYINKDRYKLTGVNITIKRSECRVISDSKSRHSSEQPNAQCCPFGRLDRRELNKWIRITVDRGASICQYLNEILVK